MKLLRKFTIILISIFVHGKKLHHLILLHIESLKGLGMGTSTLYTIQEATYLGNVTRALICLEMF